MASFEDARAATLAEWLDEYGQLQWRRDRGGGHVWVSDIERTESQAEAAAGLASILSRIQVLQYDAKWEVITRLALSRSAVVDGAVEIMPCAAWEVLARANRQAFEEAVRRLRDSDHPDKSVLLRVAQDFAQRF